MIRLPDVTLMAVSSIKIPETILALQKSMEGIEFGDIRLITHQKPENLPLNIRYGYCDQIDNIHKYNEFMFLNAWEYFDTEFVLIQQYDSWIINSDYWQKEWLYVDYLGSPWKYLLDAYICHATGEHVRVGNGGFSLRSSQLMRTPNKMGWNIRSEQGYDSEDGNFAVYWRKEMLEQGIKYGLVGQAAHFAFENNVPENLHISKFFGFHKNYPRR